MSLVRIVGGSEQAQSEIARQLRAHGLEVESTPCDANRPDADWEITLEECSALEALTKAFAFAEENSDISVLVSPGVILCYSEASNCAVSPEVQTREQIVRHEFAIEASESPASRADESVYKPLCESQSGGKEASNQTTDAVKPLDEMWPIAPAVTDQATLPIEPEPALRTDPAEESAAAFFGEPSESRHNEEKASDAQVLPWEDSPVAFQSLNEKVSDWPIWQATDNEPALPAGPQLKNSGQQLTWAWILSLGSITLRILKTANTAEDLLTRPWCVKVAGATTAIAVLALLFATTAHRFSPLSAKILRGSALASQPVPFQKLKNFNAATGTASHAARASTAALSASSATSAQASQAIHAQLLKASRKLARDDSAGRDFVAKDVVIRYGSGPARRRSNRETPEPGVKYYTDLK